jgi:hypothetical protein
MVATSSRAISRESSAPTGRLPTELRGCSTKKLRYPALRSPLTNTLTWADPRELWSWRGTWTPNLPITRHLCQQLTNRECPGQEFTFIIRHRANRPLFQRASTRCYTVFDRNFCLHEHYAVRKCSTRVARRAEGRALSEWTVLHSRLGVQPVTADGRTARSATASPRANRRPLARWAAGQWSAAGRCGRRRARRRCRPPRAAGHYQAEFPGGLEDADGELIGIGVDGAGRQSAVTSCRAAAASASGVLAATWKISSVSGWQWRRSSACWKPPARSRLSR